MKFKEVDFVALNHQSNNNFKYRRIVALAVSITIIIISIYLCIALSLKNTSNIDTPNNQEENVEAEPEESISVILNNALPVFSEEAKEQIKTIYKSEEKRVFLTFDDGPSQTVTESILDTLKENNVKATFFVLGSRVELYPEVLKREYEEGHYIANHGYSHNYKSIYASTNNVLNEYNKTEECIKNALGNQEYSSHLFRFPGGSVGGTYSKLKKNAINLLEENNIAYLDWNALNKDAEGSFNKDELLSNLIGTAEGKNSIVVLMHDTGAKVSTAEALPEVITYFRDNGYEFKNFYDIMK